MKEDNYKKFKVELKADTGEGFFNLKGVNQLEVKGNIASFLFKGNINLVLKRLAETEIANIWIEEMDLEEIFLHYYEKEE